MYGLVNRGVKELIVKNCGEEAWKEVRNKAGVETDDFSAMEAYPDSVTYSLVTSASNLLETPVEDILKTFGRHWILYTAKEGYGDMMDSWGENLPEFLENLNALHNQLRMAMPQLNPPSLEVVNPQSDSLLLHYYSDRPLLSPMVIGMLEGLGERFNTPVEVELNSPKSTEQDYDEFFVKWSDAPIQ